MSAKARHSESPRRFGTLAAVAAAVALSAGSSSQAEAATTIDLGTISTAETISGSITYAPDSLVLFKFAVTSPFSFKFTDQGSGGTFPFPIGSSITGGAGTYSQSFGSFPVSGVLSYSLTTATPAPEPASWALMIGGFGVVGGATRRRRTVRSRISFA